MVCPKTPISSLRDPMAIDPWLPRGFSPKAGMVLQRCLFAEDRWQIYDTSNNGRVLVAEAGFANQWLADGLLTGTEVDGFAYGSQRFVLVLGGRNYRLEPVDETETPDDFTDCQALVAAVRSEEHTSELQSLIGQSYAVFCLTKKKS